MTIDELYKEKGDLITQIEIANSKLLDINKKIIEIMNQPKEKDNG